MRKVNRTHWSGEHAKSLPQTNHVHSWLRRTWTAVGYVSSWEASLPLGPSSPGNAGDCQGDPLVTALFEPPACIGSSHLLFQEHIKMFRESRPETASLTSPCLNTAVTSRYSVPRAIAAEDAILIQKSGLKTAILPVGYFPNCCLLVMGGKQQYPRL